MADQRYRLTYRIRYALKHPDRIRPFLKRAWRDVRFRLGGKRDHVSYYREVMREDVANDPRQAVGSGSEERWLALGEPQFDYLGIDISPDVLLAANRTIVDRELQAAEPCLRLANDLTFDWVPGERFDVAHAHSAFSHCPLPVIEECCAHVGRILRPDGWFDLTFNATSGREHHVLHEDYYDHPETLIALAGRAGGRGR